MKWRSVNPTRDWWLCALKNTSFWHWMTCAQIRATRTRVDRRTSVASPPLRPTDSSASAPTTTSSSTASVLVSTSVSFLLCWRCDPLVGPVGLYCSTSSRPEWSKRGKMISELEHLSSRNKGICGCPDHWRVWCAIVNREGQPVEYVPFLSLCVKCLQTAALPIGVTNQAQISASVIRTTTLSPSVAARRTTKESAATPEKVSRKTL